MVSTYVSYSNLVPMIALLCVIFLSFLYTSQYFLKAECFCWVLFCQVGFEVCCCYGYLPCPTGCKCGCLVFNLRVIVSVWSCTPSLPFLLCLRRVSLYILTPLMSISPQSSCYLLFELFPWWWRTVEWNIVNGCD